MAEEAFQPTSSDYEEILARLKPLPVSTRPRLYEPKAKAAPKTEPAKSATKPAPKADS